MRLRDLVDVEVLRKLAEANHGATGMPIGILDAVDGTILVGVGWQDICTMYHRANALTAERCRESDDFIKQHLSEREPCEYTCRNGLRDIGLPITAGGRHLATLFLGQFFYEGETPDRTFFVEQARRCGFDEGAYLAALDRVPVFSRASVENILAYDAALATFISGVADAALRGHEAEQRAASLARLPQENPDPVLRLTRDLDVVYVNAAASAALVGLGVAVGRRAPPALAGLAQRALAEGRRVQGDISAGERIYSVSIVAVGDDVNAYAHDITPRVRAEEALHGAMQRLESLLENSPLAVIEWSSVGFGVSRWSDEATRMFGWTAEETVGKRIDELDWIHPEDWPLVQQVMRDMLSGVRPRNVSKNRNLRKDGTVIHCEWYNSTVADATGKLVSVLSLVLDVTERKRIEQELRDADRAKDEFLGMLSHELRNPLAPIRNSLYVLDHADPASDSARRAKEVAGRQLTHLTRLVDDLLDVTRIVRGKVDLHRTELDLADLTRRIADDHCALVRERGLQLEIEVPHEPVWVNGDETRLAQVIANLLQNAAKFTQRGGRITVSVVAHRDAAEVRVRDTGAGIEAELLVDIFNPFVQAKQSLARTEGGLGLGLALVKGLVELHGGTVRATSAGPQQGAVFTIRLPTAPAPPVPLAAPGGIEPRSTTPLRVLVVDDSQDAAESLAEVVRMLGHRAEVAFDGWSAVAAARRSPPDVVLCDIGLPDISGYEVAAALRADERCDSVQLIAVSGYALPEDRQRALDAGFAEHIAKPADPAKVLRILGRRAISAA